MALHRGTYANSGQQETYRHEGFAQMKDRGKKGENATAREEVEYKKVSEIRSTLGFSWVGEVPHMKTRNQRKHTRYKCIGRLLMSLMLSCSSIRLVSLAAFGGGEARRAARRH
jgi:hypothetical protein